MKLDDQITDVEYENKRKSLLEDKRQIKLRLKIAISKIKDLKNDAAVELLLRMLIERKYI